MVTARTPLSELRRLTALPSCATASRDRLARSVEQSMRVEGYPVTLDDVRAAMERILDRI